MTLPNFLIIGAPKAGTTSLYDYLRAHPDVFMPTLKEPRFFGYEGAPGAGDRKKWPVQSRAEYEALFAGAGDAAAVGEATPHYLFYPKAALRIAEALPGVRLIASLRNPIDRAYSVYQMNLRNKQANAGVPFARALESDANLQETYHGPLARYFEAFPRARLKIVLLDDLEAAPERAVREIFAFLGVDPGFAPDLSRVSNPGGLPRSKLLHQVMNDRRLREGARRLLPAGATEWLKALRSRNLRKGALPPEDRAAARAFFEADIRATGALIGRDLSHWLRG
jgi:hypothetical protein